MFAPRVMVDRGPRSPSTRFAGRRDRRGELPPALRPQRTERPDPGARADLRPARRVGEGPRARLHRPEWIDVPGLVYEVLDGEIEVAPGCGSIPTPGHTAGH